MLGRRLASLHWTSRSYKALAALSESEGVTQQRLADLRPHALKWCVLGRPNPGYFALFFRIARFELVTYSKN